MSIRRIALGRWFPLVLLSALGIVATRPLWSTGQFFYSHDGLLHLFRSVALDRTLHQGVVYPRWLFDLAYGYGYPVLNFYPPLAEYVIETLHLLGLGFSQAVNGTFIGIVIVALAGGYVLGKGLFEQDRQARIAGILTAIAYVFFPYFLTDIFVRGAISEALAAALLPWALWSLRRVVRRRTLGPILLAAFFLAALLFAHSLTLLMSVPVLGAYVLLEWLRLNATARRHALACLVATGAMSAALGAAYWLPFVAELSWVKMGHGIEEIERGFQIARLAANQFFTPGALIQPSWLYEYGPFALGLVPVALGILAVVMACFAWRKLNERSTVFLFALVAFFGAIAMLDVSREAWRRIPFATMIQFPWRVSVLIGLGTAIVTGSLPVTLSKIGWTDTNLISLPSWKRGLSSILGNVASILVALVLVWTAIANLTPLQLFLPPEPTLGQLARFEEISGFVGTTTFGEYLPATAGVLLEHDPAAGHPIRQPAADIQLVQYAATERSLSVSASEPVSISLRMLYFPDWQATLDGRPISIHPSSPNGFITLDVPPGDHRVVVRLVDTLPRQVGDALSGLSILALLAAGIVLSRRHEPEAAALLIITLLAAMVMALPAAVALSAAPQPLQRTKTPISPELDLIGLTVEGARYEPKGWHIVKPQPPLHLQVIWQVKQLIQDEPVTWQLVDGAGRVWLEQKQLSRYSTGSPVLWVTNEVVEDHYDLPLDTAIPRGQYTLKACFGNSLVCVAASAITLEQSWTPVNRPVPIAHPTQIRVGNDIQFLGNDTLPTLLRPGDKFPLTLYWETDRSLPDDFIRYVQLIDVDDQVAAQMGDGSPQVNGLNPTSLWVPGEIVPDPREFSVPLNIRPGLYRLAVGMYRYPDGERLSLPAEAGTAAEDVIVLGPVKVPMMASKDQPAHLLNLSAGPSIRLTGYDGAIQDARGSRAAGGNNTTWRSSPQPGQSLALELYWQVRSNPGVDYAVFIHIMDDKGQLVLQQDQFPDERRYPTRIWEAGERVLDAHVLPLDKLTPGVYTVQVGMYQIESGERLPLVDASGRELENREIKVGSIEITPR